MIIGVDNGNANTKTACHCFTSGLTEHNVKPPMMQDIILWRGKYYSLSSERLPFMRDKTIDSNCYVLTLFALAKEIIERGKYTTKVIPVDLAVGLPPEHYGLLKDKFKNYFLSFGKDVEFEYNDAPFKLTIRGVYVYPQAYAAVACKATKLKDYSSYYIVDIGGYTIDVIHMHGLVPDYDRCYSLENGIITISNLIKSRVSASYGLTIEDNHILDVTLNRPNILDEEVRNAIKDMMHTNTTKIFNELREKKVDLRTNPAIFVSGGSLLLRPYIEASDMVKLPSFETDVAANAVGYEQLACAAIKRAAEATKKN